MAENCTCTKISSDRCKCSRWRFKTMLRIYNRERQRCYALVCNFFSSNIFESLNVVECVAPSRHQLHPRGLSIGAKTQQRHFTSECPKFLPRDDSCASFLHMLTKFSTSSAKSGVSHCQIPAPRFDVPQHTIKRPDYMSRAGPPYTGRRV